MNKYYKIFYVGNSLSYKFDLHYISVKVTVNEIFMNNHFFQPLTSHKNFSSRGEVREVSTYYYKPK